MSWVNKIYKNIWLLFFLLATNASIAQEGTPLQFLSGVSQSSTYYPSLQNKTEKLVIGLPFLSGIGANWDANFSFNYLFSDQFSYSFEKFYEKLQEPGDAISSINIPIVYLSYRRENQTFGFSISEKMLADCNFDNEFLNFIAHGIEDYYGKDETFGPISLKAKIYREVKFSYARQINNRLSLGAGAKVLFGKFYYDMQNLNIAVTSDQSANTMQITPIGNFAISGPLSIEQYTDSLDIKTNLDPGDYFFKFKNMGLAVDLGFTYETQEGTTISAAVNDLGFTTLKDNTYDVTYDGSLDYSAQDFYQSNDTTNINTYFEPKEALLAIIDSLPYLASEKQVYDRRYEMLPVKINLMVSQKINQSMSVGLSNNYTYQKDNSNNFTSAFFYSTLGKHLELSTNLVLYNFEEIFPGFGINYTTRSTQLYLATNNILKLVQPTSAKNLNLCFGVNFLFSTNSK
jgi:hypothetical protein